jgi:hypothetical protein
MQTHDAIVRTIAADLRAKRRDILTPHTWHGEVWGTCTQRTVA